MVSPDPRRCSRARGALHLFTVAATLLGGLACDLETTISPAPPRPSIEVAEQAVCSGQPLPLQRIDAVVAAPDGRLAVVGARFDPLQPGDLSFIPSAFIIAVLDPKAGLEVTRLIEFPGDAYPPTPIAWDGDRLLINHDGRRLAPPDDPDGPGFDVPYGTLGRLDPYAPSAHIDGDRAFMVLGERIPTGSVLRQFVVAERGGEGEAPSRVVTSYGSLRAEAIGIFEGGVEDASVYGWHIEPDGRLIVKALVQTRDLLRNVFHIGYPTPVDSDPEAGWFPPGSLDSDATRTWLDYDPDDPWYPRGFYGLRQGEDGRARTTLFDQRTNSSHVFAFTDQAEPVIEHTLEPRPVTADHVRIWDFVQVDGDLVAAGSVCLVRPFDVEVEYDPFARKCRPVVARYTTSGPPRIQWMTKTDGDEAFEHAQAIRRVGDAFVVFIDRHRDSFVGPAAYLSPPAEVVRLGLDGRCLGP